MAVRGQTVMCGSQLKHHAGRGVDSGLPCLGPLKLCHYLLCKGVTQDGTETVLG